VDDKIDIAYILQQLGRASMSATAIYPKSRPKSLKKDLRDGMVQ
jgi:hypothetical protein